MANKTASQLAEDGGAVDIQLLVENDNSKTDKEIEESKDGSCISPTNDDSV